MATKVKSKQFIYGRFENLGGVSGYGVLAVSPGLDKKSVENQLVSSIAGPIEAMSLYWDSVVSLAPVFSFVRLSDQRFLLTSLMYRKDKVRLDRDSRSCPIYHGHLISSAEMQKLDFNPFHLIENQDAFVQAPDELLDWKEKIEGSEYVETSIDKSELEVNSLDWPDEELKKLLVSGSEVVRIGGPASEVHEFLKFIYGKRIARGDRNFFSMYPKVEMKYPYQFVVGERTGRDSFVDTIEQKIYFSSSGGKKSSDSGSRQGEGPADKSFFFEQWHVTTKGKSLKQCLSEYPTARMLDELEKGDVSGAVREKAGNWNATLVEDFWARKGKERILKAIASRVQAGLSHPLSQSLVFLGLDRAKSTIDRILFTAVGTNLNEAKLVLECRGWLEQCQTSLDFNLIEKDLHWMILRAEEHEDWGTWLVASTLAKPKSMHNRPELSSLAQEERAEITRIFPQIPVSQEWGKEKDPASALARPAYLWNDDDLVDYLCEVDLEDADLTSAIRQHLGQRLSAIEPQFFAKAVRRHPELSRWLSNSAGESETDSAGSTVQKQTGKWGWFFGR